MPAVIEKTRKKSKPLATATESLQDKRPFWDENGFNREEFRKYMSELAERGSKAWEGVDVQVWLDEMRGRV